MIGFQRVRLELYLWSQPFENRTVWPSAIQTSLDFKSPLHVLLDGVLVLTRSYSQLTSINRLIKTGLNWICCYLCDETSAAKFLFKSSSSTSDRISQSRSTSAMCLIFSSKSLGRAKKFESLQTFRRDFRSFLMAFLAASFSRFCSSYNSSREKHIWYLTRTVYDRLQLEHRVQHMIVGLHFVLFSNGPDHWKTELLASLDHFIYQHNTFSF